MTDTPPAVPGTVSGGGLLARVGAARQARDVAEREMLQLVAAWAATHPAPGLEALPVGEVYADHEVALAGPGAPRVSEFAVVELAAALGKSTASGKRYVGDVVELTARLPRLWARLVAGELQAWRGLQIAQRTKQLSAAAAAWVDAQAAPRAHRLGPIQLWRLIEEAITRYNPETQIETALAQTYVTITPAGGIGGLADLAHVEAQVALADALALEQAVAATAHALAAEYPDHDLNERRALALGRLADHTLTGAGTADTHAAADDRAGAGRSAGPGARGLSLVVHLDEPGLAAAGLARVHTATGGQHLVTVESVAAWCLQPGTKVTIRPVLDLAAPITCAGYAPSPALREQVQLLSPTCAFPHCPIPAQRCDLDHIIAWDAGGTTSTDNLAPLCRLHHRVKTHGAWTYTQPHPGLYHWTSPTRHHYQRDRDGTTHLDVNDAAREGMPAASALDPPAHVRSSR